MRAYIINLDRATDRRSFAEQAFAGTKFDLCWISAVDGDTLKIPVEGYSEGLYRCFHGRPTNLRHVGCYLSHVKAMEAFLATNDEHALIAEDDLVLRADFEAVLEAALSYSEHWNILRLTGLSEGRPAKVAKLCCDYSMCVSLGRLKGTGAYVLDRAAARAWVARLLPMRLPIDHALDREWFYGLRAVYILPFPAYQTESGFFSSIHLGTSMKLSALRRSVTTYPYQTFNEVTRWLFRTFSYLRMKLIMMFAAKSSDAQSKPAG
jgi:glycosyl transferase family 25